METIHNELMELHISGLSAIKKVFQNAFTPVNHFGFDKFTKEEKNLDLFGGIYINDPISSSNGKKDDKIEAKVQETII